MLRQGGVETGTGEGGETAAVPTKCNLPSTDVDNLSRTRTYLRLNKQHQQTEEQKKKKSFLPVKASDQRAEPVLEQPEFNTIMKQFSSKQMWRHMC